MSKSLRQRHCAQLQLQQPRATTSRIHPSLYNAAHAKNGQIHPGTPWEYDMNNFEHLLCPVQSIAKTQKTYKDYYRTKLLSLARSTSVINFLGISVNIHELCGGSPLYGDVALNVNAFRHNAAQDGEASFNNNNLASAAVFPHLCSVVLPHFRSEQRQCPTQSELLHRISQFLLLPQLPQCEPISLRDTQPFLQSLALMYAFHSQKLQHLQRSHFPLYFPH